MCVRRVGVARKKTKGLSQDTESRVGSDDRPDEAQQEMKDGNPGCY